MKTPTLFAATGLALLALSACNNEPQVIDTRAPDPLAEKAKLAPKKIVPPTIEATVTFRCKDNSVVTVDFFKEGKMANLHTEKNAMPKNLQAPEAGQPFVAEGGYKLTGNKSAVTVEVPGKGSRSCHV